MGDSEAVTASTEFTPGQAYQQLLEGSSDEIRKLLVESLTLYSQDTDQQAGITDKAKTDELRKSFAAIQDWLLTEQLPKDLNLAQKIFLISGAVGDTAKIQTEAGDLEVSLLDPETYQFLCQSFLQKTELPDWTEMIFDVEDKIRGIASGDLDEYDPDRKIRKGQVATKKADHKRLVDDFTVKMEKLSASTQAASKELDKSLAALITGASPEILKKTKIHLDIMKKLRQILGLPRDLKPEEEKIVTTLASRLPSSAKELDQVGSKLAEAAALMKEQAKIMSDSLTVYAQYKENLKKVRASGDATSTRKRFISYDAQALETIKKENKILGEFLPSSSEKSSLRMSMSSSRILVSEHLKHSTDPTEALCTVEAVAKAFQKISALHTNLFPKDPRGNPIIPPFIIEPIRNFVDFFDDRMIMGFVSGEPPRKGSSVSFSSAEMQVLRACGVYLAKDPIYDYRGDIAGGTFMGDYAGQIEKKAAVKWTGENKKFSVVSTSEVTDSAGRDDATQDYMDFIFNVANNLPPSSKLSQRKKNILLKYVEFQSPIQTATLILRYSFPADAIEARDLLLAHTERSADKAREMVEEIFKTDPQTAKMLGGKASYVIRKMFT